MYVPDFRALVVASSLVFALANVPVYLHARAMTHFVDSGTRTPPPEQLTRAGKLKVLLTGVEIPRPASDTTPHDRGLLAAAVAFPGEVGTIRGWWIDAEQPRGSVVVLHGYAGSSSQMLDTAAWLHIEGWNVLLIDFRGSGDSAGTSTTVGIREASEVRAAVDWTRRRLATSPPGPLGVYGFSMGGAAALRAASHGLDADFLVVENTFGSFRATVARRFELMGLPGFPLADWLILWGSVQMGENGFAHAPATYARSVAQPTLVLQGEGDARVDPTQAWAILDALPDGRVAWFESGGHRPGISSAPVAWGEAMRDFLHRR